MKILKVDGIITKEVNTGEADKIVTIISKKLGKIQAVARGARRPHSRLIAGTQLLCYSNFVLQKGKELYEIRNCEVIESFYNIRTNLVTLTYSAHVVDLVNEVSEENLSYPKLLQLFLNTLHMLAKRDRSEELLIRIFEFRLMSIIGFEPQVVECVNCKGIDEVYYFSPKLGGILCSSCQVNDELSIKISQPALNAVRYIIYCEFKKLFSFDVSQNVLSELKLISEKYLYSHLDKKFEKLKFLDEINDGDNK